MITIKHKISQRLKKISDIEDSIMDFEKSEIKNKKVTSIIKEKKDKIAKYQREIVALEKELEAEENRCHHNENVLQSIVKEAKEYSLSEYLVLNENTLDYIKLDLKLSCKECGEIRTVSVKKLMLNLKKEMKHFSDINEILEKSNISIS